MKNQFKIALSALIALQMGCATHPSPPVANVDDFHGFPPPVDPVIPQGKPIVKQENLPLAPEVGGNAHERDVASDGEMPVRKNYRGNRSSAINFFNKRPGEIFLYDYLPGTLNHEKNRMVSQDAALVLTISGERLALLNNNLFDTGIDTDKSAEYLEKEQDGKGKCEKLMSTPHRESEGNCYYFGLGKNNSDKVEFKNLKYDEKPQAGNAEARFGRNSPPPNQEMAEKYIKDIYQPDANSEMMSPNPRLISKELLSRKNGIQKAEIINTLAGAWLQAMNHDWFSHGKNVSKKRQEEMKNNPEMAKLFEPFMVPDPEFPEDRSKDMMIPRTRPDMSHIIGKEANPPANGYPATFRNSVTHWWDASEIYGSDRKTILEVRTSPTEGLLDDGKIAVDEKNKRLYYRADGTPLTGFSDNWWVGLELFHTIFHLEHNKIVDMLKSKYPQSAVEKIYSQPITKKMLGEWYYQKARLIVAAEMARIHTVEWTPALLDNDALHVGMYANWHGLLSAIRELPLIASSQILSSSLLSEKNKQAFGGLTGPSADLYLYKAPFTLTEEFVSVYRMHPLLPDSVKVYDLTGAEKGSVKLEESLFEKSKTLTYSSPDATTNILFSLGINNPGALTLNNYPDFLRNVKIKRNTDDPSQDIIMDMGAVDVLRDRERMVPRYNEFRRMLGKALRNPAVAAEIKKNYPNDPLPLEPIKSFEELTNNPEHLAALKKVYGDDVEKLDLVVGTLAEKDRYAGYAFGNTPFYIFAIMASRRLMADPFFNKYYTAQVYTKEGIDWIEKSTMTDVILRNFPELKSKFKGVTNAFQPWNLKAK